MCGRLRVVKETTPAPFIRGVGVRCLGTSAMSRILPSVRRRRRDPRTADDSGRGAARPSRAAHGLAYLLVATAPLNAAVEIGPPAAVGVHPLYVTRAIEISDVPAVALVLVAVWDWWRNRRGGERRSAPPPLRLSVPIVALAGLALITSPFALSPPLASYTALRWLLAAGVAWALVRVGPSPRGLTIALLLALLPQAVIGLLQVARQGPLGLPFEVGILPGQPGASTTWLRGGHWVRAYGLTFHTNVLGGFLAVGVIAGVPLLARAWAHVSWWLLWGALLATLSRSAWLATAVAFPLVCGWSVARGPEFRRPILGAALGAAVVLLSGGWLFAEPIAARLAPLLHATSTGIGAAVRGLAAAEWERLEMVDLALRTIRAHPIVGIGAGTFPLAMLTAGTSTSPQYVHNVPLLLAAEVGVVGGCLWLWIWISAAGVLLARWRLLSVWAVSALSAVAVIAVISLFDSYPWSLQSGRLLTVLILAMADRALAGGEAES